MVGIGNVMLITGLNEVINMGVGTAGGQKHIVVHYQVITGPVAHQFVAVSIQNIATGCLNPCKGCKGGGVVNDTTGFNDLQVIHFVYKENQQQRKQQQQNRCTESAYSFHASPPMVPMAFATG